MGHETNLVMHSNLAKLSKCNMRLHQILLVLFAISANHSHAETLSFIKTGSIYCPEKHESDLVQIIDAQSEHQIKKAIGGAIFSGSCVGASSTPLVITKVVEKTTPSKRHFYCFNFVDLDGNPTDERECSALESVTTVAEERRKRIGDYEIVGEGVGGLKAKCTEGGIVIIHKGKKWTRESMVLPSLNPPSEIIISTDKDREIRDGCKGVDTVE
jgi:hypothetical protein